MKNIFCLLIIILAVSNICYSQEDDKLFAMIYSKGKQWNESISTSEQAYFKEHSMHLQHLRESNKIVIGGKYSDVGFMILKTRDIKEAELITEQDPSVINGTFKVELFEFKPFYKGCIGEL